MLSKPKVSVIIPTRNRKDFLLEAIDSVLAQTFQDFELIVVDNVSTDGTEQALQKYTGSIKYIYQKSGGRAEARNAGIKTAQGEYIAFLDDDDVWRNDKLAKQVNLLDARKDVGLVHNFTEVINEKGHLLEGQTQQRLKLYRKAEKIGYTYAGMSRLCVMFISSVMVRELCIDKMGLFDGHTETFEDWDFYLRVSLEYQIYTIPEFLVRYRLHSAQTAAEEFTRGRINTALKHLALLESRKEISSCGRLQYNFYLHLANACYINRQPLMFKSYAIKALELSPLKLLFSRTAIHLLITMLPPGFLTMVLQLRNYIENGNNSAFRIQRRGVIASDRRERSNLKMNSIQGEKLERYSERIDPGKTFGGSLAAHLKRYDFAKPFCIGKDVLDLACGAGYGSQYLSENAKCIIGVDISNQAIGYAKTHYQKDNLQFRIMDICRLDFPDKYFDVICAFEILEHLDMPEKLILEARRVLKEGGMLIVSTPNVKKTTHRPDNPFHKVEFSRNDFENFLKDYFIDVRVLAQRRRQSLWHYYIQKLDVLHLRGRLSVSLRKKICHTLDTNSWNEAGLGDFIIDNKKTKGALNLIAVCHLR